MRNLIVFIFSLISMLLFSCNKSNTYQPIPVITPIVNYAGIYNGSEKKVRTYPNDKTKSPYTWAQGANQTTIKINSTGHYLFDQECNENLYFNENKKITISRDFSQLSVRQVRSTNWEVKGDTLIGTSVLNTYFNNSTTSINNTKETITRTCFLQK
jgi:hypothetical protein